MTFNPNAGSQISLTDAAAMTAEYRLNNPGDVIAIYYGAHIISQILSQKKCVGIRIYYGLTNNDTKTKELVLVGVDADGNDLTDFVVDRGSPCPNDCSGSNALNS